MSITRKILPAVAMVIALSPLVAQAHSAVAAPQTVHISPITSVNNDEFSRQNTLQIFWGGPIIGLRISF